jgi:[FeFe] hydrogenase H-cluster maturation GTPase HydF
MGLNEVISADRVHIAFFGMRNAGKSSVVNAVTGQDLSVVSDIKGTTTDPVKKSMELLPIGPVVIIDTPGLDDEGALGELRVKKAREVLNQTDIAVLIVDGTKGLSEEDRELVKLFEEREIPHLTVYNKSDLTEVSTDRKQEDKAPVTGSEEAEKTLRISALTGEGIYELKEALGDFARKNKKEEKYIVKDLLKEGDLVVLVIPVDESAPKGRLILPQQQVMRELLDYHHSFVTCQDTELKDTLAKLKEKPALVITDSQAFEKVSKDTPEDILLTSFSILMARYKGFLDTAVKGAGAIDSLKDGDRVLISEGCTHHRQCGDIGTVKLPNWLAQRTQKSLVIETSSGADFPENLEDYKLIIHCGGCMLSSREMIYRMKCAEDAGIPFTNYGIAIAFMKGILDRTISPIFKTGDGSLS